MALRNDPRMFSGGAVVFDSRPHLNLFLKLEEQKRLKDERFNEYMQEQSKMINPAGVRHQEVPVITDMTKQMEDFAIQNRKNIQNPRLDNGAARMKFENMTKDIAGLINESKETTKSWDKMDAIWLDPERRKRLNKNIFNRTAELQNNPLRIKDENGRWIPNPDHVRFDPSAIEFNAKPLDSSTFVKKFSDIKRTALPPVTVKDPKNLKETITTTFVFDEGGKDAIARRAVNEYFNDDSFQSAVDASSPDDYREMFQKNFGKEIENKADLATAVAFGMLQNEVKETKYQDDDIARADRTAAMNFANAKKLADYREGLKRTTDALKNAKNTTEQNGVLDRFVNQLYSVSNDSRTVTIDDKKYDGKTIVLPSSISNKYKKIMVGSNKDGTLDYSNTIEIEPTSWVLTDDKKFIIPIYQEGKTKTGNPKLFKGMSKPIPITTFKAELRPLLLSIKDAPNEVLGNGGGGDDDVLTADDL